MSALEITALVGTAINTLLLMAISAFVKDVLTRIQIVEERTYVKSTGKDERITLLEAFDADMQRELGKVILQMAALEQDMGLRIYKLRRAIHASRMENRKWRKNLSQRDESRKRSQDQLEKTSHQVGQIASIINRFDKRIIELEKVVLNKDYIMLKNKKDKS